MSKKAKLKRIIGKKTSQRLSIIKIYINVLGNRFYRKIKKKRIKQKSVYIDIEKFSVPKMHTFFSYYDFTPFSKNNKLMLANIAPPIKRSPSKNDQMGIGFFEINIGIQPLATHIGEQHDSRK